MKRVAVLIVTYNSADDLPGCLASVAKLDHHPLELVVADCGSTDPSVEVARGFSAPDIPTQVLPLEENRGFSGGMNAALAATDAPYVLSLNADARPRPSYVSPLLAHLREASHGAATGRLIRPAVDPPRRLDACGMYLTRTWRHLDRGSGEPDEGQFQRAERVFGATGAATLFARRALEDVRFQDGEVFDTAFHSYREDAELAFRLQERGWHVVYEPTAVAEHRRHNLPSLRREMSAAVNYHSLKNRYLLRLYHQTAGNALLTLPTTLWRDLQALIYVCLFERTSLPAYAWLWRHRRQILRRRREIQARRRIPATTVNRWFRITAEPLSEEPE